MPRVNIYDTVQLPEAKEGDVIIIMSKDEAIGIVDAIRRIDACEEEDDDIGTIVAFADLLDK